MAGRGVGVGVGGRWKENAAGGTSVENEISRRSVHGTHHA